MLPARLHVRPGRSKRSGHRSGCAAASQRGGNIHDVALSPADKQGLGAVHRLGIVARHRPHRRAQPQGTPGRGAPRAASAPEGGPLKQRGPPVGQHNVLDQLFLEKEVGPLECIKEPPHTGCEVARRAADQVSGVRRT